jgi:hypothetical protein
MGMIYDTDSKSVSSCLVTLDDDPNSTVTSDINGRYTFEYVQYGRHSLLFRRSGYETYKMSFSFLNKTQVAYSRLVSQGSLYIAVAKSLDERKWDDASSYLARADAISVQEPISSYLSAMIAYRQKDYINAAKKLEALPPADYREPYVYLFLADIYEYHLNDRDKAVANLQSYLLLREDNAVRARLEKLKQDTK